MQTRSTIRLFLRLAFLWALSGCGGGSGPGANNPQTTPAQLSISWAARSRVANAPSSALSAVVTLAGAKPGGGDFTWTLDRNAAPAAYTRSYTSTSLATVGTWPLSVRFYAQTGGAGAVTATAAANVTLQADGTGIGDITMMGTIASVMVDAGQSVNVGQTKDLTFTTRDAAGSLLAVTQGSAFFAIVTGADKLTLTQSGSATGVAAGWATVTANVDGKTSPTQTVTVSGGIASTAGIYVMEEHRLDYASDITGAGWTTLGSEGMGADQFERATGVAVDGAGRIYVADNANNWIARIDDMTGKNWTTLGTTGSGVNQFFQPIDVFVDGVGRIYVADGNNRIVRIDDMTGKNWTTYSTTAVDLYVDANNRIYATQADSTILRMDDMTGKNLVTYGSRGSGIGQFSSPRGIWVDGMGRIYIADFGNNRIVRIDDMTGKNWMSLGTFGSGTNQFDSPWGVALDSAGRIYVTDIDNNRVVRFDDMTGKNWASLGPAGSGAGAFGLLYGIFVR